MMTVKFKDAISAQACILVSWLRDGRGFGFDY